MIASDEYLSVNHQSHDLDLNFTRGLVIEIEVSSSTMIMWSVNTVVAGSSLTVGRVL